MVLSILDKVHTLQESKRVQENKEGCPMIIKVIRNIAKRFSGITLNIGLVGFNFDRSGPCRVYGINILHLIVKKDIFF